MTKRFRTTDESPNLAENWGIIQSMQHGSPIEQHNHTYKICPIDCDGKNIRDKIKIIYQTKEYISLCKRPL